MKVSTLIIAKGPIQLRFYVNFTKHTARIKKAYTESIRLITRNLYSW